MNQILNVTLTDGERESSTSLPVLVRESLVECYSKFSVTPHQYDGVLFYNLSPELTIDPTTLHAYVCYEGKGGERRGEVLFWVMCAGGCVCVL